MNKPAETVVRDDGVAGSNPATPTSLRTDTCTDTPEIQPAVAHTCADLAIEWEWHPPAPIKLAGFKRALLYAWRKKHGDKCSECKSKMLFDVPRTVPRSLPRHATIDHIRPKARGGKARDLANMRVICFRCNNHKGDKWPIVSPAKEGSP